MKRRVIKQANQAYTITLPIEWVRKNQIDKNTEVDVLIKEKALIINSDKPVVGGKMKIDANGLKINGIVGILNAAYAKGIDEVELKNKKDISGDLIRYLNQNLGYALVEQKDDTYLIKDIKGGETQDLDEVFKRVFQMLILFLESAIKDIFGEACEELENLRARDREVNKFCLYLERGINKMSYAKSIRGRALFTYAFELEKVGDEIMRLWRTDIRCKVKKNDKIKKLTELSLKNLGLAFELYYQFNLNKIDDIYQLRNKIRKDSLKLTNLDADTTRFVRQIVNIAEASSDLTPLTLMMNL